MVVTDILIYVGFLDTVLLFKRGVGLDFVTDMVLVCGSG